MSCSREGDVLHKGRLEGVTPHTERISGILEDMSMRVPCSTAEGMGMSCPALRDHSRRTNKGVGTFVILYSWGIKAGNHKGFL